MIRKSPIRKVFIFTRECHRDNAASLADILYEDFGIYSEIRNVAEFWDGGIKKFEELIGSLKEKNKRLLIVCFNLRKSSCPGSKCVIREHSAVPVVPLVFKGAKNDMGFAVVQILKALAGAREEAECG